MKVYRQRCRDKNGNVIFRSEIVRRIPTQEELKAILHYEPSTGVFTHLRTCGKAKAGHVAGHQGLTGYLTIRVFNSLLQAQRLAVLYMTGEFPPAGHTVDHVNGKRDDNRWINLRVATRQQQVWNTPAHHHNKTGLKGAWRCKSTGRWLSMLQDGKRRIWLGRFDTAQEAHRAWMNAAAELRGSEWMLRAQSEAA